MSRVLVVAVHPDDETLGCGATLLRHVRRGDEVFWLIVTSMSEEVGFSPERIRRRELEIESVASFYGFADRLSLGFPTTTLDTHPIADIVRGISDCFQRFRPNTVYVPFVHDAHSDHRVSFDAVTAALKSYRARSIDRIAMMETLSETNQAPPVPGRGFVPHAYVDVTETLEGKIDALKFYEGELGEHPFPRSVEAVRALACLRGSEVGFPAAEAFMLVREVW